MYQICRTLKVNYPELGKKIIRIIFILIIFNFIFIYTFSILDVRNIFGNSKFQKFIFIQIKTELLCFRVQNKYKDRLPTCWTRYCSV